MKDAQDILDEVLGAADPVEQELGLNKMFTPTVPRPSKDVEDVDADYEYQRENFYNLIEKGQDAKDRDSSTGTDKTSTND